MRTKIIGLTVAVIVVSMIGVFTTGLFTHNLTVKVEPL